MGIWNLDGERMEVRSHTKQPHRACKSKIFNRGAYPHAPPLGGSGSACTHHFPTPTANSCMKPAYVGTHPSFLLPQTAEWGAGSSCEKCGIPFFWNMKEMWAKKTVGVRQVRSLVVRSLLILQLLLMVHSTHLSPPPAPLSEVWACTVRQVLGPDLHLSSHGVRDPRPHVPGLSLCHHHRRVSTSSPERRNRNMDT